MFSVGQKVVCVDDSELFAGSPIKKGAVYTVAGNYTSCDGRPAVTLVGLTRKSFYWGRGWGMHRFRPIVERKTDIGFAHEILRKATKKAPALALTSGDRK